MGISDCAMFFSEKVPNAKQSNSFSRPTSEESDQIQEQDRQEERKRKQREERGDQILVSNSLRIKIPSLGVGEFKDDDDGGFRTPTSLDQRIPLIPQCPPPAPRKPKSLIPLKKRKACSGRILLDLSSEVESLFPPSLLADLGGKIKKVKKVN